MIKIFIKEQNNNLIIENDYLPIVCGNSNYVFEFAFGEDWQQISNKLAIIVVGEQKTAINFSGNELKLPALPNATNMQLVVISAETENTNLRTAVLCVDLKPTLTASDLPEFEPLSNYVEQILASFEELKNGEFEIRRCEFAENAIFAENSTFAENSNHSQKAEFANTASNVSNPNLLINGNFAINQRGQTEYNGTVYTVDRWKQTEITTTQNNDKTLTITNFRNYGRLIQEVEDLTSLNGKTVTLSVKFKNVSYSQNSDPRILIYDGISNTISETITNGFSGVFSITKVLDNNLTKLEIRAIHNHLNTTESDLSVIVEWVKLEIGSTATTFIPRPYAEELSLCQRYYIKLKNQSNYAIYWKCWFNGGTTNADGFLPLPTTMRTLPTVKTTGKLIVVKTSGGSLTLNSCSAHILYPNQLLMRCSSSGGTQGQECMIQANNDNSTSIELDAEIY